MLCKKPYVTRQGLPFGCGSCLTCLMARRRVWVHRLLLEARGSALSSFVTLTYAPEMVPHGASLVPEHCVLWLKRLRKKVGTRKLRYFLVGEYGEKSQRPHYHVALFGLGLSDTTLIRDSWGNGHVMVGNLTVQSASYIVGYVTKKMTAKEDSRLCGRYPEFARMSRRPGIGFSSVALVSGAVKRLPGSIISTGFVPSVLKHGVKAFPLGRYLRGKIREFVYGDMAKAVSSVEQEAYGSEMRELWKSEIAKSENASCSFSEIVSRRDAQKVLTAESLFDIKRQRRSI